MNACECVLSRACFCISCLTPGSTCSLPHGYRELDDKIHYLRQVAAKFGFCFYASSAIGTLEDVAYWYSKMNAPPPPNLGTVITPPNSFPAKALADALISTGAPLRGLRKILELLQTEYSIVTTACVNGQGKVEVDALLSVANNPATPHELHELLLNFATFFRGDLDLDVLTSTKLGFQLYVADAVPTWPLPCPLYPWLWESMGKLEQDHAHGGLVSYVTGVTLPTARDVGLALGRLAARIPVCRLVLQVYGHPACLPVVVHLFLPHAEARKLQLHPSDLRVDVEGPVRLVVHGL